MAHGTVTVTSFAESWPYDTLIHHLLLNEEICHIHLFIQLALTHHLSL
jgi:hypothetical protein